jgi:CheY-like chemotaxis protein
MTRHIPVQILAAEGERHHALSLGAFSMLSKPITTDELGRGLDAVRAFARRGRRELLIVENTPAEPGPIVALVGNGDVETTVARSAQECLRLLDSRRFDCVVVDTKLPDMSGLDLLGAVQHEAEAQDMPFILFNQEKLSGEERSLLQAISTSIVVREVHSPERLLDECALFLHRKVSALTQAQQDMLSSLYDGDESLANKKVLLVDDDVRNIFALSSVLERHNMHVISATTGRDAIRLIEETADIALVLLDIMMPEMDGYETMYRIRSKPRFQRLPIIALTAKAMKGDREKCLAAGASDYVAKPVDADRLLSVLRVWLHR